MEWKRKCVREVGWHVSRLPLFSPLHFLFLSVFLFESSQRVGGIEGE